MATKPQGKAVEVKEALAKFEKPGDRVEGQLVGVELDVKTRMGENTIYRLETEDGTMTTVFGTAILRRKMQAAVIGDWVELELTEIQKIEGGQTLKLFKVGVIKADVPEAAHS